MAEHSQSSRLPMKPRLFFDALIPTVTASEGSQAKPFALASGRQVPKGNGFKGLWLGPSGEFPAQCLQALGQAGTLRRSEEHTSELQSLMRISYAVFCLKKKTNNIDNANFRLTIVDTRHIQLAQRTEMTI